jgi:acetyltransferase-like isoleucine patch superfamily enzyme
MSETSLKYKLARTILGAATRLAYPIYGYQALNVAHLFVPDKFMPDMLRHYGANIGNDVEIRGPVRFTNAGLELATCYRNLSIGDRSCLERELYLDILDQIIIENNVTLAMRVTITTHTGLANSQLKEHLYPFSHAPVIIRENAYIGAGVTILQGVEIGSYSVIAAGAVVTKSVPPHTVCGGVPARILKNLSWISAYASRDPLSRVAQ